MHDDQEMEAFEEAVSPHGRCDECGVPLTEEEANAAMDNGVRYDRVLSVPYKRYEPGVGMPEFDPDEDVSDMPVIVATHGFAEVYAGQSFGEVAEKMIPVSLHQNADICIWHRYYMRLVAVVRRGEVMWFVPPDFFCDDDEDDEPPE
jgi:hypothetical protein